MCAWWGPLALFYGSNKAGYDYRDVAFCLKCWKFDVRLACRGTSWLRAQRTIQSLSLRNGSCKYHNQIKFYLGIYRPCERVIQTCLGWNSPVMSLKFRDSCLRREHLIRWRFEITTLLLRVCVGDITGFSVFEFLPVENSSSHALTLMCVLI